ncbi:zincin [Trichodelitschia bisporula]|uniref:Zincin n=1 Tax=Trichodelitschia bisporula TaxID=703511 RepID=A0A6G1I1K0_9PEZI|nr:zincin [Trichodelitschia bisporula]
MDDVSRDLLHAILEAPYAENATFAGAARAVDKENFAKMQTAYKTCLDEDRIRAAGVEPLRKILAEFDAVFPLEKPKDAGADELTQTHIWLMRNGVGGFVSAEPEADDKSPDENVIFVGGGDVGLPSKEYYDKKAVVANYTRTMAQMATIIKTGVPITNETITKPVDQALLDEAAKIVELEARIARASPDRDTVGKVTYYYNPSTPEAIEKLVPEIHLRTYLAANLPANYTVKRVILSDPWYFGNLSSILTSTPRPVLHAYFRSRLVSSWAGRLHKDFRYPAKAFGNALAGRNPDAEAERWRTCLSEVDGTLGWLLSAAYVERAFSPEAKELGDRIVRDIKNIFSERLKGFDWMSDAVKTAAAKKVVNIIQKVGYPTASPNVMDPEDLRKWYAKLEVGESYFENGRAYGNFGREKAWADFLKPVDRNRWGMTAPTVNAYYSPSGNEIVFPAGIMQLPVFGVDLPEYVSYGAFGSVAGHELTHGFDNDGSHYDETGKYAEWWDNTTLANFDARTQCFVDQYSKFTIPGLDGEPLHINGRLTLGENIADAGGLTASYSAWKKRDAAKADLLIPGLEKWSKEQLFFVSYANWWCGKVRPAQAVNYVYTDAHSPADKRILGTMANSKGFREAFNCPTKQPTCELW